MDNIKRLIITAMIPLIMTAAGCMREDLPPVADSPSAPEGVDLTCMVNLNAFQSALEVMPDTRAGDHSPEENIAVRNVRSLAFFIVESEAPWRMVAYRIITPDDPEMEGVYYLGKDPELKEGDPDFRLNLLTDRKTRVGETGDASYDADLIYKDDQHYGCWKDGKIDNGCVGYNGFAKMGDDNNMVTENSYPALDSGPQGIPDGLYDESYDEDGDGQYTGFREYKAGTRMRKSRAVILTFKYDNPMHGPIEKLTRGNYYLLAMANFRESLSNVIERTGTYIAGVEEESFSTPATPEYIETHVEHIIQKWDKENGLPPDVYREFIDGCVCLSEVTIGSTGDIRNGVTPNPFIRSKKARIVCTGSEEVTLVPGDENIFTYNMTRSVARVTFRVSNHSSQTLTLSDFSLSSNFAQAATFLFHREDIHDKLFRPEWQGSPVVSSEKAIVPFVDSREIAPYSTSVDFFDALVYESGYTDEPLAYNLTLSYGTKTKKMGSYVAATGISETVIGSVNGFRNSIESTGDSKVYMLDNKGSGTGYIYYDMYSGFIRGSTTVTNLNQAKQLSLDAFPYYLWEITRTGEDGTSAKVVIRNIAADKYVKVPDSQGNGQANRLLLTDRENATEFTVKKTTSNVEVAFGYGDGYLHIESGGKYGVWGIPDWHGNYSGYNAYEVTPRGYTINAFDYETGISKPLYTLHRNNHLIVDIGVTYNTVTEDLEFEVKNWIPKDNDIEFN